VRFAGDYKGINRRTRKTFMLVWKETIKRLIYAAGWMGADPETLAETATNLWRPSPEAYEGGRERIFAMR